MRNVDTIPQTALYIMRLGMMVAIFMIGLVYFRVPTGVASYRANSRAAVRIIRPPQRFIIVSRSPMNAQANPTATTASKVESMAASIGPIR